MPSDRVLRAPPKKVICGGEKVHVIVRVRPESTVEHAEALRGASLGSGSSNAVLEADVRSSMVEGMCFDRVFTAGTTNDDMFRESLLPTVDSWVSGYNACVFAYGQTGSGKTHTMLGPDGGKGVLDGMIPLTASYALCEIRTEEETNARVSENVSQFRIQASYIEVYNNELRDLLGNGTVEVRENVDKEVYVDGATLITISGPEDCIRLVRQGSRQRATGRTNMNEHSSRSHAIFALHLQHRWRDASCGDDPRAFKMKTSVLNLVDLAGSEYAKKTGNVGQQLKESIAINTGLFCLGNVIAALAGQRDRRCGDHIPYRDSVLTRLLQSSLGGDARTVMIACCSPAWCNREETLGTLRYASGARAITNRPQVKVEDVWEEPQPLEGDIADVEPALDRRTMWVETPLGDIFCRCVGNEEDELILFVHGSGPTNSSTWWNGIVYELAVRSPTPYYMVAIDCPGYGRSPGDRQTIRSNPGSLIMSLIWNLGKTYALSLVGSSQGACAVFNAVLEVPHIAHHVVVMDPVGHDVFRYKAIKQSCLLIFDTEDAGHPVKVGRWMRDNLPLATYFEFASSKEPYWHCDHMVTEMIKLFHAPGKKRILTEADVKCANVRLAGGLCAWVEHGGFGEPIKQITEGLLKPPSSMLSEIVPDEGMRRQLTVTTSSEDVSVNAGEPLGTVWRVEKDPKTGRIFYVCDDTLEVVWKRPKNVTIRGEGAVKTSAFKEGELFEEPNTKLSVVEESTIEKTTRLLAETQELQCLKCDNTLWKPRRMRKCRHALCFKCYHAGPLYGAPCPVCNVAGDVLDVEHAHYAFLDAHPAAQARGPEYAADCEVRERSGYLVFEYGNTAVGASGSAYSVEAFLKCVNYFKGSKCKRVVNVKRLVQRVEFNINPDFPKAAVKVTEANHQGAFTLSRTMASAFPCDMAVFFTDASVPPISIPYQIRHVPSTRLVAVVVLPSSPEDQRTQIPKHKKPVPVALTGADGVEFNI